MNGFILTSFISTVALAIYSILKFTIANPIKWVVLYCLVDAFIEIFSNALAFNGIPNIFLYYILVWIETFVLLLYYKSVSSTIGSIFYLKLFIPVYSIFFLILVILSSSRSICPYSGIFQGLLIFVLGLISFHDELRAARYSDILREPFFWFVASFIVYYGCCSIVLIGAKIFAVDKEVFNYIWNYQNILSILKNIMIATGFMLSRK